MVQSQNSPQWGVVGLIRQQGKVQVCEDYIIVKSPWSVFCWSFDPCHKISMWLVRGKTRQWEYCADKVIIFKTDVPHFVLKRTGNWVVFVTNTAWSGSRKNLKAKFDGSGILYTQAVSDGLEPGNTIITESDEGQDEIYGSACSAAVYLSSVILNTHEE